MIVCGIDKEDLFQPRLKGLVAIIPQLLLLGNVFRSLVRFSDPRPRSEVSTLILRGGGFGSSVELGKSTKLNGP